jgi:hypothetical protein
MTIVVSCMQSRQKHKIPAYDFWQPYFLEGAKEAGFDVLEVPGVDWAKGLTFDKNQKGLLQWRSEVWEKTVTFVRNAQKKRRISFFLSYLYPCQIEESGIGELQKNGIPCVNFFCDNVREFNQIPKAFHKFDLNWVPEYEALPMYQKAKTRHMHLPMPCWVEPKWRREVQTHSESLPTFIGSADILRRELLGKAIACGADIVIRGPGWKNPESSSCISRNENLFFNQIQNFKQSGLLGLLAKAIDKTWHIRPKQIDPKRMLDPVSGSNYVIATREAKVTIGINRVPISRRPLRFPLSYSRLRDIEAPMLGACYLTEWTHGLGKLYDLGTEIESYRSPEELAEKLQMLAGNLQLRSKLRRLGQQRALQDHTVAASLRKITLFLGGRLP